MAKKCPTGFVCTDTTTIWFVVLLVFVIGGGLWWMGLLPAAGSAMRTPVIHVPEPKVIVMPAPAAPPATVIAPSLFPEPVRRLGLGLGGGLPTIQTRGPSSPFEQVGVLTAEGGSSSSAAPDRTVLPLYGRELDSRRSKWNYYTRTDGANPIQVPVRVGNRACDDDTNGCNELFNDDTVHVPVLGRSFKATVYRKSLFA